MFGNIGNGNNLGGDGGVGVGGVLRTIADFTPIGSVLDIKEGIENGDGWQVALGVGSLVLDMFTLGSALLVKGAVKTGIKQGVKAFGKKALTDDKLIQKAANFAKKKYKDIDRFTGKKAHNYSRDLLKEYERRYGKRGFGYDEYFNHAGKGYLDVINHNTKKIYDFKFGKKGWTKGQFEKYKKAFPGYDVKMIRKE